MEHNEANAKILADKLSRTLKIHDFMFAEKFCDKTLEEQRQMVNARILENISNAQPFVCVHFETYPKLDREMEAGGWCCKHFDERTKYYPIWCDDMYADASKYEGKTVKLSCNSRAQIDGVISAEQFYQETLKKQIGELIFRIEANSEGWFSSANLSFEAYPILIQVMSELGWGHKICQTASGNKSAFYPLCGYDEEKVAKSIQLKVNVLR